MGEDLFVCSCGEATSDYRGGQCDRCGNLHCWDCHESFLKKYGENKDGCLAKCSKCEGKGWSDSDESEDEEAEEVPELETDSEESEEVSTKPPHEIICDYKKALQPLVQKPQRVWRVSIDFHNETDGDLGLYVDKEGAVKHACTRFQQLLADNDSYDDDGDLDASLWSVCLQRCPLN